ncbi:MAG: hypothetical protein ACRCVK_12000, partial [Aeromonas veronii]
SSRTKNGVKHKLGHQLIKKKMCAITANTNYSQLYPQKKYLHHLLSLFFGVSLEFMFITMQSGCTVIT